jgi:hypothetical protein
LICVQLGVGDISLPRVAVHFALTLVMEILVFCSSGSIKDVLNIFRVTPWYLKQWTVWSDQFLSTNFSPCNIVESNQYNLYSLNTDYDVHTVRWMKYDFKFHYVLIFCYNNVSYTAIFSDGMCQYAYRQRVVSYCKLVRSQKLHIS